MKEKQKKEGRVGFFYDHFGSPSHLMYLKYRSEKPMQVPLWTLRWQGLHRGTCLRLILLIIFPKASSLAFMPLICFKWCISTFFVLPQLAQHCPSAVIECIFQSFISIGSFEFSVPKKFIGFLLRVGHLKSSNTDEPSLLIMVSLTDGP